MKQLVSILIPAYNAEAWIADTIRSAITQTWPRKEIIVVDDGSTDQTLAVARRFASKEVAVVTQKNQGASAARNHALSLSQGDYIQWLDADDLLSPDKIASQIGGIEEVPKQSNTVLVGMGLLRVPDRAGMRTATWLVSRELTDATGPWDNRLFVDDDGEYFCRAIVASDGIRFIPEAKVLYRVTPSSRLSYIGR